MDQRIELSPNCSLTPATAALSFATVAAVSLPISLLFAWRGLWPVLLFWVLEMTALGAALCVSLRRQRYGQTLLISDARIELVTRSRHGEARQEFARHWAKVRLRSPRARLRPSRLTIESHGRACVVGSFLTDEERASLAVRLRRVVGGHGESPPTDEDFTEGTLPR